ncbi:Translin-1 [Sporothrix epigloea]|uniref:Translin-1 n=1 Tax=Sporothrix epigloea TaxID=1892477 RepID=A0ABP0DSR5_9PEZI
MINPRVFESLKAKAEQDLAVRAQLDGILETLERSVAYTQGVLSRVHSTPRALYPTALLPAVNTAVADEVATVRELATVASAHPYYKYNHRWTRHLQDAIFTVLLAAWLGGVPLDADAKLAEQLKPSETSEPSQPVVGRMLTLEEVGQVFGVPVEVQHDAFHIALEEYLSALTSLTDELGRLAMNAVTLGDGELAVRISCFVKDLHAGFQLLNLKNDFLRKKVDGVKYAVKKVEGVIYDLALRGLLPAKETEEVEVKEVKEANTAATVADNNMNEA